MKPTSTTTMWPQVLPCDLYMAFLALESLLDSASVWVPFLAESRTLLPLWLYPIKILAHGVTNLLLGVHVLVTQAWQWW